MRYQSTKTYGHEIGLSCAFRQWRAESHCRFVHGYALSFRFVFEANELDDKNWVIDFGALKSLKATLQSYFDHTLQVAMDDPHLSYFKQGHEMGVMSVVIVKSVGCEMFAKLAKELADAWLVDNGLEERCRVVSVEASEHGANSALYLEEQ